MEKHTWHWEGSDGVDADLVEHFRPTDGLAHMIDLSYLLQ